MENKIIDDFVCPSCKGSLFQLEQKFQCSNCQNVYPINKGIIDFRGNRQDYYFNPVSGNDMDTIINRIKSSDNWAEVVRTFIELVGPKSPGSWIDNLTVDGRYGWKIFLDLSKEKSLLDIGCGLGNLVSNIAPHVGKTYAMDLTYKRLQFAEKRISIFNADDNFSFIAGGDQKYLPFPDHSIDCVTLSGVLEWVGEGDSSLYRIGSKSQRLWNMLFKHFGDTNPRNIQIAFLSEIKRVLKKDGQLFVGIENRLNHEYFTGRPDHHSNLKYGSLMPRFIANLYSILINRRPYRTFTYSIPGYKKLFKEAGFDNLEFIGLINGYSFLRKMIPAEANSQNWRPDKEKSFKNKLYTNKYLVPAYGIIASSVKKKRSSLLDRLFIAINCELNNDLYHSHFITRSYVVTEKEKLIIKGSIDARDIVIKLPLNQFSLVLQEKNRLLLEKTAGLSVSPSFLCQANIGSLQGFVEDEIKGEAIFTSVPFKDSLKVLYQNVAELLRKLNPKPFHLEKTSLSGIFYERVVEQPLELLFRELKDEELDSRLRRYFSDHLKGEYFIPGICHGDLSASNILVGPDNSYRLIDWEAGMVDGLPILDSINFVGSCYRYLSKKGSMSDTIDKLTSKNFRDTEGWYFLVEQYGYFEIDLALHRHLVHLNWLHHVSHLLPFSLKFNKKSIDKFIYDVAIKI